MDRISLTTKISFFPPTDNPLSANVVLVEGNEYMWIYDVGNNIEIVNYINNIDKKKNIILSHFHLDHVANLDSINYEELYQGRFTYNHTKTGLVVEKKQTFIDGDLKVTIMPYPSSHAKGSIALEVNEKYLFTGDGTYTTTKNGKYCYNAGLLLEQIRLLKATHADYILQSHQEEFCIEKESVIESLTKIYEKRIIGEPYIYL